MAAYVLLPRNTATYRDLFIWAEDGMCHIVDRKTGELTDSLTVDKFRGRMQAIAEVLGNQTQDENMKRYRGVERRTVKRFIEDCEGVAKMAVLQGEPANPDAVKMRIASKPTQIFLPGVTREGVTRELRPQPQTIVTERQQRVDRSPQQTKRAYEALLSAGRF